MVGGSADVHFELVLVPCSGVMSRSMLLDAITDNTSLHLLIDGRKIRKFDRSSMRPPEVAGTDPFLHGEWQSSDFALITGLTHRSQWKDHISNEACLFLSS